MTSLMVADEEKPLHAITQRLDTVAADRQALEDTNAPSPRRLPGSGLHTKEPATARVRVNQRYSATRRSSDGS